MRDRCRCGEAECNRRSGTIPIDEGYLYYRGDNTHWHGLMWPPNRTALINLTGICWYWREIIINTPNFWTRIDSLTALSDIVELWIKRSKTLPLDVTTLTTTVSRIHLDQLTFIMENISRIENLQLLNPGCFRCIPQNTHVPLLRSLNITLILRDDPLGPIDLALNAPLLDAIKLEGITIRPSSYALFNNVRRLMLTQQRLSRTVESLTVEEVLQLLTHCQHSLVELEVTTSDFHQPQVFARNTPAASLELPQLRRLAWNTPSISPNLLRFIATPVLQTLHVVFKTIERDQNLSHFIPESLVQLSKSSPVLLHAYHPFTSTFGINLYADSAQENKLFAFSLRNESAGGPLGVRNFEAFFEMFFEAFLKAHKLLSLVDRHFSRPSAKCLSIDTRNERKG